MNSKMENSEKEKRDTEEVRVAEGVVEEVTTTQTETPDGKVVTKTEVDVKEVVSAEVESGTKTEETVAAEEDIEIKGEVVATSDGTVVEEEGAEKVTLVSDQALADGVSEGAEVAAEKTEEVVATAAAVSDSAPKKLEEAALPTSDTNVGESSGAADSVSNEILGSNVSRGNQEMSQIPRSTENQQFVAPTPRTSTSCLNCCGLLDLLKRSNQ